MKFVCLPFALLLLSGCAIASSTAGGAARPMPAQAPLDEEALRRLFLSGLNTYLAPVRSTEVITDHPSSELFRPNGTYSRKAGRFGPDGWYAIEGDRLCVVGDGIPKQCRKLVPQQGTTYLLIDVSDSSQSLMNLWQVK